MTQWPKTCTCCPRSYTPESWRSLAYVGVQTCDDGGPALELRNCPCGSTIAIKLPANDVDQEAA